MQKIHNLKTITVNHMAINYFYIKSKNDINGNPRYKVFIIDPFAPSVHEKLFKCYEGQIRTHVINFIETALEA